MAKAGARDASTRTSLAVATLLRLADADLRDAAVLESGRDPGNAPALAGQAVTRLIDAVVTSERGWGVEPAGDLAAIPDENPLKRPLAALRRRLPLVPARQPLADGRVPPAPDRGLLRDGVVAARALLKDLAARFGTDLFGTGTAGTIAPIRPEPPPPPPKPPEPAPALPRRAAPPIVVAPARPPVAPPSAEPHVVAGRSTIAPRANPGSIASTAFWSLMDRWNVPDEAALDLVGHPGGLTKKGTRPRFKLTGEEVDLFQGLLEIDAGLVPLKLDPAAWLYDPIKGKPFAGETPLAFLTRMRLPGVRATIGFLLQSGLRLSLSA